MSWWTDGHNGDNITESNIFYMRIQVVKMLVPN